MTKTIKTKLNKLKRNDFLNNNLLKHCLKVFLFKNISKICFRFVNLWLCINMIGLKRDERFRMI